MEGTLFKLLEKVELRVKGRERKKREKREECKKIEK